MYGFVYEVIDKNRVLVKPFPEEELSSVFGSEEQVASIRQALIVRERDQEQEPLIVLYDEDNMELLEVTADESYTV